jgi:outer membrane protein assembly factor BamB
VRGLAAVLVVALALVAGGSVAPGPALADGPLLQGSPWPEMRHDLRNTGESQIRGAYRGERPWSFTTQRGIFSTPVIDDRGVVYVGSADGNFYALGRDGSTLWRFRTGGIIAGSLDISFEGLGEISVVFEEVETDIEDNFVGGSILFDATDSDIDGVVGIRVGFTTDVVVPVSVILDDQSVLDFDFDTISGELTPVSN